jgi:competence protein ComEC
MTDLVSKLPKKWVIPPLLAVAILVSVAAANMPDNNLHLSFLDVGQGDSILVEFPGRKKMLVDGGGVPDDSFDIGENVVSPLLWRKGIKKIDYLVLTHAHPDHMNGLKAVARNFKVGRYWEAFSPPQTPAYEELKNNLGPYVPKERIFRGFKHQEGDVRIEVIHPEEESPFVLEASNDKSVVLRLSLGDIGFLLASDIGLEAESEITGKNLDVQAHVLKSPHHGSRSSSSEAFLEKVRPQIVVVTAGRGNLYGVPHQEILDRYKNMGARILRTDEEGAVEIAADGKAILIRTAREESSSH